MEYYGNTLCVSINDLVNHNIMSYECYKSMCRRNSLNVMRQGKGAGNIALIAVDSLPTKYKEAVKEVFPGGPEVRLRGWITSNYEVDQHAMCYFQSRQQTGLDLSAEKIIEYVTNASVLNTCINQTLRTRLRLPQADGRTLRLGHDGQDHQGAEGNLSSYPTRIDTEIPEEGEYKIGGYGVLISGKFGNQNTRKVDVKTEKLVLGLQCLPNKPLNSQVKDLYDAFVCGELDVYDIQTGELFNPEDFCDKDGNPKSLSDSTIRNILNKPKNRLIWDKSQLSWSTFMHESMPHMHRHAGEYSLSQITMDDVDLTRKLKDTKLRVKAYYAYDSVSQCVLGASYSRDKDQNLVKECFREMFRLISKHGWGIPAGIEVENHLMSEYKYTLLQEGTVFSYVRYCAPLNSQEKQAENLNGAKKRRIIHRNHVGIGRFYGKWKYRVESKKISDAGNDTWEDKQYFTFDELVADDRRDNYEWNHTLHPNQKKYPGMTRWDVLMEHINPNLRPFDAITLARYIGEKVETSVRRNSTVRVAYEDWWLSKPDVLERLAPNNYKVTAYYLPDEDGKPQDVFIFQGDRYIDQVERVETYNRVMAEQTEEDKKKFYHQQKKVKEFMNYTNRNLVPRLGIHNSKDYEKEQQKEIEELAAKPTGMDIYTSDVPDSDFGVQTAGKVLQGTSSISEEDEDALAIAMAFEQV